MTRNGQEHNNYEIIYELYKLSSVVLPEKNTWSLDELASRLCMIESNLSKTELVDKLKLILNELKEKQAVILVNDSKVYSLVEPKLLELVNLSKSGKTI